MNEFEWIVDPEQLVSFLLEAEFARPDSLERLTQELVTSLHPHLGASIKRYQFYFCAEDEFSNSDFWISNPDLQPVKADLLQVRCCIWRSSYSNKLRIRCYLLLFEQNLLVSPFPPQHNAVIALDLKEENNKLKWVGRWEKGDGPGEWEGPPQRELFSQYRRYIWKNGEWVSESYLENLIAELIEVHNYWTGNLPLKDLRAKYNL